MGSGKQTRKYQKHKLVTNYTVNKTKNVSLERNQQGNKINNSTVKSCLGRMLKQEIVISKDGKYGFHPALIMMRLQADGVSVDPYIPQCNPRKR